MANEIVVVRTEESVELLRRERGTLPWRLDRKRARRCKYVVCTHCIPADSAEGAEDYTAFLVGKICDVVPCNPIQEGDDAPRYKPFFIECSEFALVDEIPVFWKGVRNPLSYRSAGDLNFDLSTLKWEPMPGSQSASELVVEIPLAPQPKATVGALTMAEAKKGLALTFHVPPEAIEITIRG